MPPERLSLFGVEDGTDLLERLQHASTSGNHLPHTSQHRGKPDAGGTSAVPTRAAPRKPRCKRAAPLQLASVSLAGPAYLRDPDAPESPPAITMSSPTSYCKPGGGATVFLGSRGRGRGDLVPIPSSSNSPPPASSKLPRKAGPRQQKIPASGIQQRRLIARPAKPAQQASRECGASPAQLVTRLLHEQAEVLLQGDGAASPGGARLIGWPGARCDASCVSPTAKTGGGGALPRPPLCDKVERRLAQELKVAHGDDATLRAYQTAFALFIEGFPAYRDLLSRIQSAYDDRVSYCAALCARVDELEARLGSSREEADERIESAYYETNALIMETNANTRDVRRTMEDAMISQRTLTADNTSLTEKVSELQKKLERDKQELYRLRSALSYTSDVCEGLKVKQHTAMDYYESQLEHHRVEKSALEYRIEQLTDLVECYEKHGRKKPLP